MLRTTFLTSLMGLTMLLGAMGVSNAAGMDCCAAKDCKCPANCAYCEKGCKDKCCCAPKKGCDGGHCKH